VDRDELRQEGVVGLLRAVERYDPTQGTPFWGYAKFWVRQAMRQLVHQQRGEASLDEHVRHRAVARAEAPAAAPMGEDHDAVRIGRHGEVAVEHNPVGRDLDRRLTYTSGLVTHYTPQG
jgi:DNA-directed RNA polymerase sigma subunit (sigma70/sigma32)